MDFQAAWYSTVPVITVTIGMITYHRYGFPLPPSTPSSYGICCFLQTHRLIHVGPP